jgi:hypothetical protein
MGWNACLLKANKQQSLGLMALPAEAVRQIVAHLPYGDVTVTASVCKRISTVCSDGSVWRQVYKGEFMKDVPDGEVSLPVAAVVETSSTSLQSLCLEIISAALFDMHCISHAPNSGCLQWYVSRSDFSPMYTLHSYQSQLHLPQILVLYADLHCRTQSAHSKLS